VEGEKLKLRALVIDDSRIMRGLVKDNLQKTELADFEFVEAGDGAEAMDVFDPDKIDVVFVDWNMPKMNGIEFARHVRSLGYANHVPVVMITSESAEGRQESAYESARITCYITKPFTLEQVKEKITPVIEKLAQRQQAAATKSPASAAPPKASGGFFSKLMG
jgi:two-component system, chemotaxis family, chemotaxis protein CheY